MEKKQVRKAVWKNLTKYFEATLEEAFNGMHAYTNAVDFKAAMIEKLTNHEDFHSALEAVYQKRINRRIQASRGSKSSPSGNPRQRSTLSSVHRPEVRTKGK